MSRLLEEILERKREEQVASEFEHTSVRQEWISNCEKLMSRITEWLSLSKMKLSRNSVKVHSDSGSVDWGITKAQPYNWSF